MAENSNRDDGRSKVTGEAAYTEDLPLPAGTIHCAVLRSDHAHARIRSIKVDEAVQFPGVVAVVTSHGLSELSAFKHGGPSPRFYSIRPQKGRAGQFPLRDGREEPEKAEWRRVDGGNFGSRQATLKRNFLSFILNYA